MLGFVGGGSEISNLMMLCLSLRGSLQTWLRDYDRIQSCAVILIYIQVTTTGFNFVCIINGLLSFSLKSICCVLGLVS